MKRRHASQVDGRRARTLKVTEALFSKSSKHKRNNYSHKHNMHLSNLLTVPHGIFIYKVYTQEPYNRVTKTSQKYFP